MSKPIVVDYDALTGDCAPVRSGAAGVRLIVAAVCTLGTESAGLREGEQDVDVEAALAFQQLEAQPSKQGWGVGVRAVRSDDSAWRSDDERLLLTPGAAVGLS
jgi:hypothetical protein